MVTVLFVNTAYIGEIFAIFRAMYEAVLIVSFFQLIIAFLCFEEDKGTVDINVLFEKLEEKGMMMWTIPISWVFKHVSVKS